MFQNKVEVAGVPINEDRGTHIRGVGWKLHGKSRGQASTTSHRDRFFGVPFGRGMDRSHIHRFRGAGPLFWTGGIVYFKLDPNVCTLLLLGQGQEMIMVQGFHRGAGCVIWAAACSERESHLSRKLDPHTNIQIDAFLHLAIQCLNLLQMGMVNLTFRMQISLPGFHVRDHLLHHMIHVFHIA